MQTKSKSACKVLSTGALFFLITVFALVCASCGKTTATQKPVVVCTSFPCYDFARAVLGDLAGGAAGSGTIGKARGDEASFGAPVERDGAGAGVELVLLLKPGQEVHNFEPTPRDLITIQNAAAFICVGGESDEWVRALLKGRDFANVSVLCLMDAVETIAETEGLEGKAGTASAGAGAASTGAGDGAAFGADVTDAKTGTALGAAARDAGHVDEADEHVWTSPENARIMVRCIKDMLCGIADSFPELDTDILEENASRYIDEIARVEERLKRVVQANREPFIVMADRFPLAYFANYYHIGYVAAFSGCSSAVEASSATIARLIETVREKKLKSVYYIELSNHKIADVVAEETGATARMLHSVQNVTKDEFVAGETWVSLMERNARTLEAGL